jgi:hypothetical protein
MKFVGVWVFEKEAGYLREEDIRVYFGGDLKCSF